MRRSIPQLACACGRLHGTSAPRVTIVLCCLIDDIHQASFNKQKAELESDLASTQQRLEDALQALAGGSAGPAAAAAAVAALQAAAPPVPCVECVAARSELEQLRAGLSQTQDQLQKVSWQPRFRIHTAGSL